MSLVTFVEDVTTLDEAVQPFYKETEGGYVLDAEPVNGYVVENITGLKSALDKERKTAKDLDRQLKTYQTKWDGMDDPEEIRAQLTKLEELVQFDPEKEADKIAEQKVESSKKRIENSLNKAWEAKWQTEVEPLKKEYDSVYKQLHKEVVTSSVLKAIAEEDGDVELLMPHITSKVKVSKRDDGSISPSVIGENDEPMYNNRGEAMSIRELVASYKTKFPAAFKSSAKSGGGAQPSGKPSNGVDMSKLPPSQRIVEGMRQKGILK